MSRHTSSVRPGRRVSSTVRISPGSSTSKDSSSRSTTAVGRPRSAAVWRCRRNESGPKRLGMAPGGRRSRRSPRDRACATPLAVPRGSRAVCRPGGSRAPRWIGPQPPPRSGASRSGASVGAPRSRAPPEPGRSPGRSRRRRRPTSPSRRPPGWRPRRPRTSPGRARPARGERGARTAGTSRGQGTSRGGRSRARARQPS